MVVINVFSIRLAILFLLSCVLRITLCQNYTVIHTALGPIRGEIISQEGNKVYRFLRIPYAKPPTGSRRFKQPVPFGRWNGTLDGTRYPPACVQPKNLKWNSSNGNLMSEDCLYINIYVPNEVKRDSNKSVMVWIHGGGFAQGQASNYDGTKLAVKGDVIYVVMNYRLNVLGFLAPPGNMGLWDQQLCLRWVKDNIASFGGNPNSVTIFGESAGGMSVSLHTLIPSNKGLFHRAIMQSGTALSKLILNESENLQHFAKVFNCNDTTSPSASSDILDCLRKIPAEDLMLETERFNNNGTLGVRVGPVVDGVFLIDSPGKLINDPTSPSYAMFRSVDIMVGTTSGEGSLMFEYQSLFNLNMTYGLTTSFLCDRFSPVLTKEVFRGISTVSQAICLKYKVQNEEEQRVKLVNLYRDLFFVSPAVDILEIHSERNKMTSTYQYSFEENSFRPVIVPKWFEEAQHGAEIPYLFDTNLILRTNQNVSHFSEKIKLAETVLEYWTNFAKYGNPNTITDKSLPQWPAYDNIERKYICLKDGISEENNIYSKYIMFWRNAIPNILNPVVHTNVGSVKGIAVLHKLGTVNQFRGIPFAKPPIRKLRFKKPTPFGNWTGTFDATRYPPSCMQTLSGDAVLISYPNKTFSEDCLYLNIYVPGNLSDSSSKAVMIWIHGGGYFVGAASQFDGSFLAAKGDIILVAMNYRLGLFGFLTSGDSVIKGNYGIWDQRLAIQWVKDNIAAFGGNPLSMTIFGQSAGGFSVGIHSISPLNKNLFHRAIAMSGTSISRIAYNKSPPNTAVHIANILRCPNTSSTIIFQCLQNKSTDQLKSAYDDFINSTQFRHEPAAQYDYFLAVVDKEIIPDEPEKLLQNTSSDSYKFFKSLDMMVGTTDGEGITMMYELQKIPDVNISKGIKPSVFRDVIAKLGAKQFAATDITEATKAICAQYMVNETGPSALGEQARQTLNMFGDELFVWGAKETLNFHFRNNNYANSYHYLFTKEVPGFFLPSWYEGSIHAGELPYLFDSMMRYFEEVYNVTFDETDDNFKMKHADYFINFAKSGNPNSKDLPRWPKYENSQYYLDFGTNITIKQRLWPKRLGLWTKLRGFDIDDHTRNPDSDISRSSTTKALTTLMFYLLILLWCM